MELILVRSSSRRWDYILLLVFAVAAAIGGWIVDQQGHRAPGMTLLIVGGLLAVISMVGLSVRLRRRRWVRLHSDGFTVVEPSGETEYEDSLVRSLALRHKENHAEGVHKSTTRTLRLWLTDGDSDDDLEVLEFVTTYDVEKDDPLASLINRLSKQILELARARLDSGKTFSGKGWVLEKNNLVIEARPEPLHCRVEELAMTGVVDQKLCLWKRGEESVWARIDIDSLNAYVLMWLLDERIAKNPEEESSTDENHLGRVIFERKPAASTRWITALGAFTLFLLGFAMMMATLAGPPRDRGAFGLIAVGILAAGVACVLGWLHLRRSLFRCHQYGLVKCGLRGEKRLRYEHVVGFTYQATRHFHNGVYTGTVFVLDFEPDADHASARIRYSVTLRQADRQLDELRQQVAMIMGEEMYRRVVNGFPVKWTPALTFQGDKLLYTPLGLFGRKEGKEIPLASITQYKMADANCDLLVDGQKKAVASESMHARNFHPGFHCLLRLIGDSAENLSEEE